MGDYKSEVTREIMLRLADQMVDVELDPEHCELAMQKAIEKYRQRSSNAVIEKFPALKLEENKNTYNLSEGTQDADIDYTVVDVLDLYHRASGAAGTGVGSELEPFQAQYLNAFLLQGGRAGGISVYDSMAQYHETLGRIFGSEYQFTWDRSSKELTIHRRPKADTTLIAHVYAERSDQDLFEDSMSKVWLKDYSLSMAKLMLGEARSKFASIVGPSGGSTMNGDALKGEALQEIANLEEDIMRNREGGWGLDFRIG